MKKEVKMNFYSKPIPSYKLECDNTEGKSIKDLNMALEFQSLGGSKWSEF